MKTGIYKITSPSGKVYIGQSLNVELRLSQYKRNDCKSQPKLLNSLNKYGSKNHLFEIIEYCTLELLNERERYWQDFYDSSKKGLNCRLTKTTDKSGTISEETKLKLRELNLGKKRTPEAILKQKQTMFLNKDSRKNPMFSKIYLEKLSSSMKISICQYNLQGEFIKEWESAKDVENFLSIKRTHIRACCRGVRKTAGGFVWKDKV